MGSKIITNCPITKMLTSANKTISKSSDKHNTI